ncbi:MAG: iron ABC transporter permease [Clostridiales bacterium]|nr:iron ABC transporter permease [Clostridiales bacterium]
MMTTKNGSWKIRYILLLIALPVLALLFSLCVGRYVVSVPDVFRSILSRFNENIEVSKLAYITIWNVRLPRILLAFVVGSALSCAGLLFQSIFRNPLATPDTLGVAGGSSFGAVLSILLGFSLIPLQLVSFGFGCLAVFLTILAAKGKNQSMSTIILSGIIMGSLFSALVSLVKFTADQEQQLPSITYWLMGSLQSATYSSLLIGLIPIAVSIIILFLLRWRLNLLMLSEEESCSSGVNMPRLRMVAILCATVATASSISMCGQVGWVGLIVPHMCRMVFGNDHRHLIPACVSFGGTFLIIVDTLARSISAAELPISILTAIIGAPFFIFLMRRKGGWNL